MQALETLIALFVTAVVLAAAARKVGAPYPVFLAVGGALLAFVPAAPNFSLPSELVLALFVAPVLLDAAYDASLRDLRDNWVPLAGLVFAAVALTTAAVAVVAHALVPAMPWAAAVALGAIVAPPDAVAATAVLRPLRPPHRILAVLEGESLLNDASSLLIYRLAVAAAVSGSFDAGAVAPTFLLAVVGGIAAGIALGWISLRLMARIDHIPTAIIVQFVCTFGVWIGAEALGLSAVLTLVCYALTLARSAPAMVGASTRVATNVVWRTVVFALNILAFIFIGLQIRPILDATPVGQRNAYLAVGAAVLVTVIVVRLAWHMLFNAFERWRYRKLDLNLPRPLMNPTIGSGLVVSWSGMRGIITLAAALALPLQFPYRGLIVLTAAAVVLGTLVIQGLTLKPLLRMLDIHDDDPVGREEALAYRAALDAALATIDGNDSPVADKVRLKFKGDFTFEHAATETVRQKISDHRALHGAGMRAARHAVLAMRSREEIGDDAFHRIEQKMDWIEMAERGGDD